MFRPPRLALLFPLIAVAAGCTSETARTSDDNEVKVDTSSPAARAQYDANVAFVTSYVPRCAASSGRPRVLVSGFGRFMTIDDNATGRIVSTLSRATPYPETTAPPPGDVDEPAPQLSVGMTTVEAPGVGTVDVCAMILPVHWDIAAILIAKEVSRFRPSFVMMNGVAGPRQPIWIELGAANRASKDRDGSNQLTPMGTSGEQHARIVAAAPQREDAQPNLLSWRAVQSAARAAVSRHAEERDDGVRFGDVLAGVELAGFPRASNAYLCNNVTYVTGWLMSHPGREVQLLTASQPLAGATNEVKVRLDGSVERIPRVFVHWPTELVDKHHEAAADVMRSIIIAQVTASAKGDAPTFGDNRNAAKDLKGGDFF